MYTTLIIMNKYGSTLQIVDSVSTKESINVF